MFYAVCGIPLLLLVLWGMLWSVFGILYSVAYPFMFVYGAVTGSDKRKDGEKTWSWGASDTSKTGRDVLSMDKVKSQKMHLNQA